MAADALARREESSVVLLRPQQDYVQLGREQEHPHHCSTQSHAHAHRGYLQVAPEVDRNERYPDDAVGVHGEADELGLVEVFRDVPCFNGVQGTEKHQAKVED